MDDVRKEFIETLSTDPSKAITALGIYVETYSEHAAGDPDSLKAGCEVIEGLFKDAAAQGCDKQALAKVRKFWNKAKEKMQNGN